MLGVDPSVAALTLQDHEGDFEKATVSLCRAIQEERVREDTPKGFHSDAQQPQKKATAGWDRRGPCKTSRYRVYRTILFLYQLTATSPFMGIQGRQAPRMLHVETLQTCQLVLPQTR